MKSICNNEKMIKIMSAARHAFWGARRYVAHASSGRLWLSNGDHNDAAAALFLILLLIQKSVTLVPNGCRQPVAGTL
jgi:hypothetical protein